MVMALWKQPREQPFTTYRDPKTGRWMTVKPDRFAQDTIIEAPLYREPTIGQSTTAHKPYGYGVGLKEPVDQTASYTRASRR